MSITAINTNLIPIWVDIYSETLEEVHGWVIGESRQHTLGREPGVAFKFGSERDCKRAIMALAKNGIMSREDILARERKEVLRICCEALPW